MFTGTYTLEYTNSALNSFAITDTSDYNDEPQDDFITRRVYFQMIDGTFYQDPNGNDYWGFGYGDYPDGVITFDFLTEDIAFNIKIAWIPDTPIDGSTYEAVHIYDFKDYMELFAMNIALAAENNKSLVNIQNFFQSAMALQTFIDCANNRQVAQDQYSDQQAIIAGTYITNNPNLFY